MIEYLFESSLFMTVAILLYFVLFARTKYFMFNRVYLLLSLMAALSIPALEIEVQFSQNYLPDIHLDPEEIKFADSSNNEFTANTQLNTSPRWVFDWPFAVLWIYIFGLMMMGFRYVKNLLSIAKLVRKSDVIQMMSHKLVLMNDRSGPFSFLNYIFVNRTQYKKREISESILLHELAHVKQRHSMDILFIESLLIFFYFNPILWIYRHALKLNHEYLADQYVLAHKPDIIEYANHLIKFNHSSDSMQFECSFNYLSSKKRLIMLTKSKSNRTQFRIKVVLAALVVSSTMALVAFKNVETPNIGTDDNDEFTVVIDLGHGGKDLGVDSSNEDMTESKIVWSIGEKMMRIETGVNLIFTRDNDTYISLSERADMANSNKADLLVSLHANWRSEREFRGIEVYYSEENEKSERSMEIANVFNNSLVFDHRKNANPLKEAGFYVLKNVKCPAILLELGFLSNERDLEYLMKESNQQDLAQQIIDILESLSQ